MIREKASAELQYKSTGLGDLEKGAIGITGINQALEITQKVADVASTALRAAFQATKAFIDTGSQFERYTIQFTTLLDSADAAQSRMEELFQFASTTPFQLPDVVEAAQKLEAYGIYSERALRAAGDAAASFGKEMGDAVEAVADAALGEFERLKEFGIKAQHIQEQLGHELTRDTKEGLEEIRQAVIEIFEEKTGGGMDALSRSLGGMISNLQDKWTGFKKIVADTRLFDTVKDIFGSILKSVESLFDTGEAERFGSIVGDTLADILESAAGALFKAADALWELVFLIGQNWENIKKTSAAGRQIAGFADPVAGPFRAVSWIKKLIGAKDEFSFEQMPWSITEALGRVGRARRGSGIYGPETPFGYGAGLYARWDQQRARRAEGQFAETGGGGAAAVGALGSPFAGEAAGGGTGGWTGAWQPIEFYDALEAKQSETYEKMLDVEYEQAQATMDTWADVQGALMAGWNRMYAFSTQAGERWRKGEKIGLKDLGQAYTEFGRGILTSYIQNKADEWGLKATEEGINAIAALARYDFWAAAQHGAAAAGYVALGATAGTIAGAISAPSGSGGSAEGYAGAGVDVGAQDATPGGTRHISRTTGISAQNITYNLYIVHNGTTVYGDPEEFFQEGILPQIQDAQALGAI
jgi:hypothetical protein